jgi:hypothetical protein
LRRANGGALRIGHSGSVNKSNSKSKTIPLIKVGMGIGMGTLLSAIKIKEWRNFILLSFSILLYFGKF